MESIHSNRTYIHLCKYILYDYFPHTILYLLINFSRNFSCFVFSAIKCLAVQLFNLSLLETFFSIIICYICYIYVASVCWSIQNLRYTLSCHNAVYLYFVLFICRVLLLPVFFLPVVGFVFVASFLMSHTTHKFFNVHQPPSPPNSIQFLGVHIVQIEMACSYIAITK